MNSCASPGEARLTEKSPALEPHQRRALDIIQVVEGADVIAAERAVPQGHFRIDALLRMSRAPTGMWGPLREVVADRLVVLELDSRPPSRKKLVRARLKHFFVLDEWHQRPMHGTRPPMLLTISDGTPRKALAATQHLQPGHLRGLWRSTEDLTCGSAWLVDLKSLARRPGTSVLRLLRRPRTPDEAREQLAALLADDALLSSQRDRLMEAVMEHRVHTDKQEHETWTEFYTRVGRADGIARTILVILEARDLTPSLEQRQRILECGDEATLLRWAEHATRVDAIDALFEAP